MTSRPRTMRPALIALALFGVLASWPAHAKSAKQKAQDYCKQWEREHPGQECGIVRGWVCTGKDWKKLKTFNAAWTSCRQVRGQADMAKAEGRCKDYRRNEGGSCEVHYPGCRPGWVKLGKYGRYSACRPIEASGNLRYDAYKAFMRKWEGFADQSMSQTMNAFLTKHYDFDVQRIRWGIVDNPHAGCTTDCYDIYCNGNKNIAENIEGRVFSELMFHELAHVEQCRAKGGRREYAKMWFGDLPPGFFNALGSRVKDEFADRVHDEMPMEKDAAHKAKTVLRAYLDGHYNVKWRCRLYKDGKPVWNSGDRFFRVECEDPSHPAYRAARAKYEQLSARSGGAGRYVYRFGTENDVRLHIWEETVLPKRARKPVPTRASKP